jgi:hypothetical protein
MPSNLTPWPNAWDWAFFLVHQTHLACVSSFSVHSLLPFQRILRSLPRKGYCLSMLAFPKYLIQSHASLLFLQLKNTLDSASNYFALVTTYMSISMLMIIAIALHHFTSFLDINFTQQTNSRYSYDHCSQHILTPANLHWLTRTQVSVKLHCTYNQTTTHHHNTSLIFKGNVARRLYHTVLLCLLLILHPGGKQMTFRLNHWALTSLKPIAKH